jgi:hypothetical protein
MPFICRHLLDNADLPFISRCWLGFFGSHTCLHDHSVFAELHAIPSAIRNRAGAVQGAAKQKQTKCIWARMANRTNRKNNWGFSAPGAERRRFDGWAGGWVEKGPLVCWRGA